MSHLHLNARNKELETLVVLSLFLLVLTAITHKQFFMYVSMSLLVVALFIKPVAGVIARGWLSFADIFGSFNNKLILALVFYLLLTPLAYIYRQFHRNALDILPVKEKKSLYIVRDHLFAKEDLEKMW